jgi:hypothetical protein
MCQARDYGNEIEVGIGIKAALDAGVCKREDLWYGPSPHVPGLAQPETCPHGHVYLFQRAHSPHPPEYLLTRPASR